MANTISLDLKSIYEDTSDGISVVCGPMLRYWGITDGFWRGSATYVTRDDQSNYVSIPVFSIIDKPPMKIFNAHGFSFWRADFEIQLGESEKLVQYSWGSIHEPKIFAVPGKDETMNTMFYSCNGFSLSTPTEKFPGSLWDDVMQKHSNKAFHVMLGGGDQLYNDSLTTYLPNILTRMHHQHLPRFVAEGKRKALTADQRDVIDKFYLGSYLLWYGRGYWKGLAGDTHQTGFVEALASIPSLNIYDDHDIIDGFGSYRGRTQRDPLFLQIGESAFRYYLLFQGSISPDGGDPKRADPSWVNTGKPGPYIKHPALSIWAKLGKGAAFYGLDCRTERTRRQICDKSSYDAMFKRIEEETEKDTDIKHLYLMIGVPIAYPRMVWAERLMESVFVTPFKWLAKKKIILKGFVNDFDGQVELLDDLNDHWCATPHKQERNRFIRRLQALSKKRSLRVTILSGDVHLAACGRFMSQDKNISEANDFRYMVCPISSAIVNTPPPPMLADFLNKRNKMHYLGKDTEEDMVPLFPEDTDGSERHDTHMMPRRNYCILSPVDKGAINMSICVEQDSSKNSGETKQYGMEIPALTSK